MASKPRDLTTGEVAKLAHVSSRTVQKWVDTGLLDGYKVPGTKHRRINKDMLRAFLVKHSMPIPSELQIKHDS